MKKFQYCFNLMGAGMTLLLALLLVGCGSSGGSGTATGMGTLSVSLTDAPACGLEAVNVTVSKVRVHQSSSASDQTAGWADITLNTPRKINLLDLNDPTQPNLALDSLGDTPLEAGHYTQLRLVLEPNSNNPHAALSNSVVLAGTSTEIALDTPSAIQSGVKLIHQFEVGAGQHVDLVLDFDACKSVVAHNNGKYILKPVIKVIPLVLNGIKGFVDTSLLGSNVVVSAQMNGEVVRATMPNTATGEFFLARLGASAYPASYDVVITADGHATGVIAGVPVASSTSVTTISTSGAPFTLATSTSQNLNGTVTLNPADDDSAVYVVAKQTLNPGPTVTVKSQVATLLTGNPVGDYSYALALPVAASALGHYSSSLPITLTAGAQGAVAGVYTAEGSAQTDTTAYSTQTPSPSPVNIPATQNFTLTP